MNPIKWIMRRIQRRKELAEVARRADAEMRRREENRLDMEETFRTLAEKKEEVSNG